MRVALAEELGGIDSVELSERPAPAPAAGQALVRVHGAGVGLWDVGFLGGGFPGLALPFVPGQEVAGVVEAAGDGAGVQPGERVYASLFPAGGGFAELALASADRLAAMPGQASFAEAAGLVIGGGTAYEDLVDRGRLQPGETVLITAAPGGVGSAAVQIAAAIGARPLGVASPPTVTTWRTWAPARSSTTTPSAGPSRCVPPFPAAWTCCWTAPAARPATRPSARSVTAAGRSSWSCKVLPPSSSAASPASRSPPTPTGRGWSNWAAWSMPASCGPRSGAVLPLEQVREALARVTGRHTRGKIVLQIAL